MSEERTPGTIPAHPCEAAIEQASLLLERLGVEAHRDFAHEIVANAYAWARKEAGQ